MGNKNQTNDNIDETLKKLRERRVLKPEAAKKILVFAVIVFIILCVICVLKWMGMI